VSAQQEIERVLPVIEGLASKCECLLSIDSSKAEVAEKALQAGARIVNDISGMTFDPEMTRLVAATGAGVVLMHIKGIPRDMQRNPHYEDVTVEVCAVLRDRIETAVQTGVAPQRIVIDPGIGFGKRVTDNLTLIRELDRLGSLGRPILVGPSRKSFIGDVLELPVDQRLEGTLAAVAVSVINGARIVRVHDVQPVRRAVDTVDAILNPAFGRDS
jgi:dihydropteroate synthase